MAWFANNWGLLLSLAVAFGPAAYVLARFYWSEKKPEPETIAFVLCFTVFILVLRQLDVWEYRSALKETCGMLEQKIIEIEADEDARNNSDDFPTECDFALGYADPSDTE